MQFSANDFLEIKDKKARVVIIIITTEAAARKAWKIQTWAEIWTLTSATHMMSSSQLAW